MDDNIKKHLQDILDAIHEIDNRDNWRSNEQDSQRGQEYRYNQLKKNCGCKELYNTRI